MPNCIHYNRFCKYRFSLHSKLSKGYVLGHYRFQARQNWLKVTVSSLWHKNSRSNDTPKKKYRLKMIEMDNNNQRRS